MRINPITNNNFSYAKSTKQKSFGNIHSNVSAPEERNLINLNYLNNTYSQVGINFKGVQNKSLALVQPLPLEDRLASLFQNFMIGDLILVGKDLKTAKKAMYQSAGLVKNVIKRAFFIPDEKIGGNLGFIKIPTGEREVINLNPEKINLISNNKTYNLDPNESLYILKDDVLNINGNLLKIKDEPKTDLSFFREKFSYSFNFENSVVPEIEKINKKAIASLAADEKKRPSKVTFADVGGQDKLIDELKKSIIYPIRYPQGYQNIDVNHGFILYGPPGTGKTHIARALASEADAEFIQLNGLELESKWVGESEANWRALFDTAKESQPCVIFIDEFDAVARSRDSQDEYGNKVVNQILTLMSDIDNEASDVYVIGATNNFKALDSAITRSGRFGKHLEVALPDKEGIGKIYDIHSKNKPLDESVSKEDIVKRLFDLKASGADIRYIINEAHNNGYERAGIFEKMENKTLKDSDISEFKILPEDFDKAIEVFSKSKNINKRNPIGYNK